MTEPVRFDALFLDLPFMDETHAQFMQLLAIVEEADDQRLLAAWRDLVDCTARGFAREDQWMNDTGYATRRDHQIQHRVVLEVMRDGITQAAKGRLSHVRQMAWQLRDWYQKHVQTMDSALAMHLRGARFAPAAPRQLAQPS